MFLFPNNLAFHSLRFIQITVSEIRHFGIYKVTDSDKNKAVY